MIEKRKQNAKLGQWLTGVEDVPLFFTIDFLWNDENETTSSLLSLSVCNKTQTRTFVLASCDYKVVIYPTLCVGVPCQRLSRKFRITTSNAYNVSFHLIFIARFRHKTIYDPIKPIYTHFFSSEKMRISECSPAGKWSLISRAHVMYVCVFQRLSFCIPTDRFTESRRLSCVKSSFGSFLSYTFFPFSNHVWCHFFFLLAFASAHLHSVYDSTFFACVYPSDFEHHVALKSYMFFID